MTKEKKFYNTLKDIFVGVKVEGESGYINLMRIKSHYFINGVFPKLQKDIEEALIPFPEFKEELFDKLYTFFSRYFSESGSIYFRYTPIHQNIYEKVYTDDKDVILFYKTHMLYYVKTDRLFKNLEIEIDGIKFFFSVSTLEHKRANEKREIVYEFKKKRKDEVIVFNVFYSERGRKTKIEEILRIIKREGITVSEEILDKAFRVFEKQSEVDYFINKNAKEFLREQFNIWLYQYVFSGESAWTEDRIKQLQTLKDIALKIIDFISQFEDELVKIWNKPKFVLNSNYVITLDKIADKKIDDINKILNHNNFKKQLDEWKELGIVDNNFNKDQILENNIIGKVLNEKYKYLPIDTKYFKDLELEILGFFDDLDNSLDGWLIKSENYQALNTILPKFKEKVQTIYIDPPFNKEQDADYFYSVKYKDSTWTTVLENRLQLAKDLLNHKGSIFVRCDYNGNMFVRLLMNEIFGEENFRNEIVVSRVSKQDTKAKKFNVGTDSIFYYSKTENVIFVTLNVKLKESKKERWHAIDSQGQGKALYIFGYLFEPPRGRHWTYGQKNIKELEAANRIKIVCRECAYEHFSGKWNGCQKCNNKENVSIKYLLAPTEKKQISSNWTDISGYTSNWNFQTENSEPLLNRVIECSSTKKEDIIIDFFLGIGTTIAVSHKLGKKWIGIEMGEHFYPFKLERGKLSGVLIRMKEVLSGKGNHEPCGISKEVNWKGGGFFKYYEFEQYEDTLRKVRYRDSELFDDPYKDPYNQYIFMRDLKMLEAMEIDNDKVKVDLSKLYKNIDIPETLSNLLGKWIKKINSDFVEFEDGERINIKEIDYKIIKPLIWW